MLLNKIQDSIGAYKNWLTGIRHHPFVYKWESLQHFQAEWNPEAAEPAKMFDRCFQNTETRRLWQEEQWYPKKMMLEFWDMDAPMLRMMFDDLFNESREPEGRIGRFLFGCDELLRDYRKAHPLSAENDHFHGDYRMIALYLAFRYPESYALYDFPVFQQAMTRFGARDVPQQNDLVRYFKVLRTLMTFLEKDGNVVPAMQKHLHPVRHYQGKTLLLAEDFCRFVTADG
ncbi:MAG: hypothetical protein KDC70_13770 [Saprospiraceae bacterium]|nr:hypothetical protein [Saprospiraceae bacterium]